MRELPEGMREAVEAGALAICGIDKWGANSEAIRNDYRHAAQQAIEAALHHLSAPPSQLPATPSEEAKDEGVRVFRRAMAQGLGRLTQAEDAFRRGLEAAYAEERRLAEERSQDG